MFKLSKSLGIVTPTLNSSRFIECTLLSVKPLIEAGAQYFIVDSGSVDDTIKICNNNGLEHIYATPGNMYHAVNKGLSKFSTEWLTYINSDDIIYTDAIFEALEQYGNTADVIYGSTDYIDSMSRFNFSKRSASPYMVKGLLKSGIMPFSQPGTLFKRDLFLKLKGFNERYRYCADFDFFLAAVLSGAKFRNYSKKTISAFRMHDNQFSSTMQTSMLSETNTIISSRVGRYNSLYTNLQKTLYRCINIDTYAGKYLRSVQSSND